MQVFFEKRLFFLFEKFNENEVITGINKWKNELL